MQTRGRFVEDEHYISLAVVFREERRQLDALALAARERRRRLPETDIPQPHVLQRLQTLDYAAASGVRIVLAEKLYGVVDAHFQRVVYALAAVAYLQHLVLETLAVARLTHQLHVGHELHAHLDGALALTLLATPSRHVEREARGRESRVHRLRLVGIEFSDLVVCLEICDGVRSRRFADGILVDHLHRLQHLDVAAQAVEIPGLLSRVGQQPTQSGIEYAFGERRFAAAAHARDAGHDAERYLDVDIPEVVLPRAADRYAAASAARDGRRLYDAPPRQIVGREALFRL